MTPTVEAESRAAMRCRHGRVPLSPLCSSYRGRLWVPTVSNDSIANANLCSTAPLYRLSQEPSLAGLNPHTKSGPHGDPNGVAYC